MQAREHVVCFVSQLGHRTTRTWHVYAWVWRLNALIADLQTGKKHQRVKKRKWYFMLNANNSMLTLTQWQWSYAAVNTKLEYLKWLGHCEVFYLFYWVLIFTQIYKPICLSLWAFLVSWMYGHVLGLVLISYLIWCYKKEQNIMTDSSVRREHDCGFTSR